MEEGDFGKAEKNPGIAQCPGRYVSLYIRPSSEVSDHETIRNILDSQGLQESRKGCPLAPNGLTNHLPPSCGAARAMHKQSARALPFMCSCSFLLPIKPPEQPISG